MSETVDLGEMLRQGAAGKFQFAGPMSVASAMPAPPVEAEDDLSAMLRQGAAGKFKPTAIPSEYAVPQGQMSGYRANIGAGIKEGVIGALSQVAGAPVDTIMRGPNFLLKQVGLPEYPSGSDAIRDALESIGIPSSEVSPGSSGQAVARGGARGAAGMLVTGGMGAAAGLPGVAAGMTPGGVAAGGVGGLAGEKARQLAPESLKPLAEFLGNAVGAGGAVLAGQGARAATSAGTGALGRMGIGPKEDVGNVRATRSQIEAAGQRASDMLGPEGRQQLTAFGDAESQAKQLEAKITDAATSPAGRVMAQKQLQAIQTQREQIVPGAQPTVAQLMPNEKTVGYEADMRLLNNPAFATRDVANNAAMTGAVREMAPGTAGPEAASSMFLRRLDEMQTAEVGAVGAGRRAVQGQTEALGGESMPTAQGQEIRGALQGAYKPVHQATGELWSAVDPDGKWALSSNPLRSTAEAIDKEMSPTAKTSGQEMKLINRAMSLPDVVRFNELSQIRSDLNTEIMALSGEKGYQPSVRRLTMLKQGVDQSIEDAVNHIASRDDAVAGRLSALEKANGEPGAGGASGEGVPTVGGPGGGAAGVAGTQGGVGAGVGRSGNPPGNSGVAAEAATGHLPGDLTPPPRAGLKPNFAPENAEAYQSAVATTRAEKERFGQGGVGQVLRPGRYGEDFRVAEGDVPRQIFTRGPSEPTEVGRFINAVGGPEKAASIGQEVLTSELRERGIITPEGLINPNKFAAWQRGRAPTIEQFPGLGEKFANAQQAQITLDQTIANHATALRDFQNGVAKNFLSADPQVAVDRVFSSGNSAGTARQLFDAVKDNPDALAGTRRGFIDHLERKFNMGEGETNPIKAKQFRDFMGQHRNAFKIMFGGQGAQNIELVEAMLDRQARAKQVEATLGSNTARKALSAGRHGAGMGEGARTTLFALIGEHLAENAAHLLGAAGAVGTIASGAGVAAGIWAHALKQAGIVTKNDLGREMMLNPELTRTLMQRAPANEPLSAVMQRHVAAALRSGAIAGMNERTSK